MSVDEDISDLITHSFGAHPRALQRIGADPTGERPTYRATLSDGRELTLRCQSAGGQVPFWHGGAPAEHWLAERARLLEWLAAQGYPAPRVVRTAHGGVLAAHGGYCALALTYLPGEPLRADTAQMAQLAAALGRLHARGAQASGDASLPDSWWSPLDVVSAGLVARLHAAQSGTPERWSALHAAFVAALEAMAARVDLPQTLIHGDCYPGNAIAAPDGAVTQIDWDCAGWGCAVLDLGALLLDVSPDPAPGAPLKVEPELIAAAVEGYRRWRTLSAAEREALPDALRFSVAFVGALRFIWAREQGWGERIERSLMRLHARFTAADEVARLARAGFEGG